MRFARKLHYLGIAIPDGYPERSHKQSNLITVSHLLLS